METEGLIAWETSNLDDGEVTKLFLYFKEGFKMQGPSRCTTAGELGAHFLNISRNPAEVSCLITCEIRIAKLQSGDHNFNNVYTGYIMYCIVLWIILHRLL